MREEIIEQGGWPASAVDGFEIEECMIDYGGMISALWNIYRQQRVELVTIGWVPLGEWRLMEMLWVVKGLSKSFSELGGRGWRNSVCCRDQRVCCCHRSEHRSGRDNPCSTTLPPPSSSRSSLEVAGNFKESRRHGSICLTVWIIICYPYSHPDSCSRFEGSWR